MQAQICTFKQQVSTTRRQARYWFNFPRAAFRQTVWYGESDAISYANFYSRSHDAVKHPALSRCFRKASGNQLPAEPSIINLDKLSLIM